MLRVSRKSLIYRFAMFFSNEPSINSGCVLIGHLALSSIFSVGIAIGVYPFIILLGGLGFHAFDYFTSGADYLSTATNLELFVVGAILSALIALIIWKTRELLVKACNRIEII